LGKILTKSHWRDLFEATGLLAIIASLVFVGMQVRQDQVIARAELGSQSFESMNSYKQLFADSDFAATFAKMLNQPKELTIDEALQIDNFLRMVRSSFIRECYLKDRGVFIECDSIIRSNLATYFGNRYAKVWWRKTKPMLGDVSWGIPEWVDEEVMNLDENRTQEVIEEIKAEL
jgi:hypothetical protein